MSEWESSGGVGGTVSERARWSEGRRNEEQQTSTCRQAICDLVLFELCKWLQCLELDLVTTTTLSRLNFVCGAVVSDARCSAVVYDAWCGVVVSDARCSAVVYDAWCSAVAWLTVAWCMVWHHTAWHCVGAAMVGSHQVSAAWCGECGIALRGRCGVGSVVRAVW